MLRRRVCRIPSGSPRWRVGGRGSLGGRGGVRGSSGRGSRRRRRLVSRAFGIAPCAGIRTVRQILPLLLFVAAALFVEQRRRCHRRCRPTTLLRVRVHRERPAPQQRNRDDDRRPHRELDLELLHQPPPPGHPPPTARLPVQTRTFRRRCAGRCRIGVWVKGGPRAYSIDGFCRRALCLGGFAERRAPQAGFKPAPTIGTFHSPVRQSFGSAQNVAQGTFSILSYLGRGGRTVALDPSGDAALC